MGKWIAEVKTAFRLGGKDKILPVSMSGSEELGRPFRYEIEMLSTKVDLKFDDQLGKALCLSHEVSQKNDKRHHHGIVSEIGSSGVFAGTEGIPYLRFSVVLRPEVWFLSHRSDNRVFQDMSVVDVVEKLFKEAGLQWKKSLTGTYDKRDYCVQYGETDFDFVSRLLENVGIYYYFEHSDSRHLMVLADGSRAHKPMAGDSKLPFRLPGEASIDLEHIAEWEWASRVETQKFTLTSYDYLKPKADLLVDDKIPQKHGQSGLERYEYGQLYREKDVGKRLVAARIEEQQVDYARWTGSANAMRMESGYTFSLTDHPDKNQNASYLVVGASYTMNQAAAGELLWDTTEESNFEVAFTAIKEQTPFRPARTTPKAIVRGPQTARVVGKKGEEIWTDKYGRVKVQFPWDRDGKMDETSSCWVRVATSLAGENWGFVTIPRIGQEVIVDFLEGDPDQPIITGSVYNEDHKPPYELPANQTQSGLKTRSSKSGSAKNFNELRFEDKKGSEEVFFHAETNFNRVVKNNDTLKVGLDKKDPGDQTIEIHNDRTVTLNEGNDALKVEKGNQDINVKKKIDIEAGDQLTIKVGKSKLVMKKNGDITMSGMKLDIKGTNSVKIKGVSSFEAGGTMVKIAGSAKTDIKGAMTKIAGSAMLDLNASGMAKLKGSITMIG
jgi:type VI secretion system secreted protein VgrG